MILFHAEAVIFSVGELSLYKLQPIQPQVLLFSSLSCFSVIKRLISLLYIESYLFQILYILLIEYLEKRNLQLLFYSILPYQNKFHLFETAIIFSFIVMSDSF